MIFDSLMGQFMLHEDDNSGPDDPQQQNQGTPTNTDQQDDAGGDEDEYTVQDPDGGEDEQDTQDTEQQEEDTGEEDEYNIQDPDEGEGEGNEEQDQQEQPEEGEEGGDEDEYAVQDPDEGGDAGGETQPDDSGSTSTDSNDPSAKLKELEKSIFDQLPPEMQKAKVAELKSLYTDTYNKCQSIIDIISTADKQPNQVKIYDYILNNLLDLQKYIKDYLSDIFDSKTYIENMTELQKYLAILDTVNGVFEDMAKTPLDGQDN